MLFRSLSAAALAAATAAAFVSSAASGGPAVPLPIHDFTLPRLEYPSYYNALDRARLEVFTGRYRNALFTLATPDSTPDSTEARLLRAEAFANLGQRDRASLILSADDLLNDTRAALLRAQISADAGRLDQSIIALREFISRTPDSLAGRQQLASVLEQSGDLEAATKELQWFVDAPQDFIKRLDDETDSTLDNATNLTAVARALDRWATITGAYQTDEALHDKLLHAFIRAYDQLDRQFWPARVAAAEFMMARDDNKGALKELTAANAINPNDARVNELFGLLALEQYNLDGADEAVRSLRAVDRHSVRAEVLEARTLLTSRQPLLAEAPLKRVLDAQPKHIEALGLLAAANALRLREAAAGELIAQVEAVDPNNATAYFEVAEQLGAMRQYPRAAQMYKVAIARAPWWIAPRNGLGLLYTQSGDEDDARIALDEAHKLDPFNLRTTNYLRLLDDLAKFARLETPHFVIYFDEKLDPIIAEPMAEYLESIHAQICREYQHEPAVKTFIEVFPTHDAFSVRTTGSPWIGTVGASTGRVIALVSPRRGQNTMGTYNWARVLRHEYTHTVTLGATENRIPHWMTEGLAVLEERKPIPWDWVPLLYHAVKNDELFTLEDLTWGFVRPKKPTDRTLAYAQSHWVCQFIQQTFGHATILKQLAMYREGKLQEEVIPATTGKSVSQFESEFFAWARAQVARWGYDEESQKKYDELRDRGEDLIKSRQYAEAVGVWEQIAALRPVDALPHQRLAGLYVSKEVNQPAKAIDAFIRLNDVELKDNRYAKRLARLYRDTGAMPKAIAVANDATLIDPYDLDAQRLLADLYERAGDVDQLARQRKTVAALETWISENRKRNKLDGATN